MATSSAIARRRNIRRLETERDKLMERIDKDRSHLKEIRMKLTEARKKK